MQPIAEHRDTRTRVALYVSTGGKAATNRRRDMEADAEQNGWAVAAIFEDGGKGRKDRPGLVAMLEAAARREFDVVMVWSVDRLGRSLTDLLATLQELRAKDVDLYLHRYGFDNSTPAGRALIQMLGICAERDHERMKERVRAGLARAKEDGTTLGRPTLETADPARVAKVRAMRAQGAGIRKIARELGVGVGTVMRLSA